MVFALSVLLAHLLIMLFPTLCVQWSVFNFLVMVSFPTGKHNPGREMLPFTFAEQFPGSSTSQALQSHKRVTQGVRYKSKTQGCPKGQWKSFTLWCAAQALLSLGPQSKRQGDREASPTCHRPLWTPVYAWLYNGHMSAKTVRDSQVPWCPPPSYTSIAIHPHVKCPFPHCSSQPGQATS